MAAIDTIAQDYAGWRRARPAAYPKGRHPFRHLLGEEAWHRLPPATRMRFGRHIDAGVCVAYVGEVVECRMSRAGWLLANLARLIGGPLPLTSDEGMPACVTVTEDIAGGGQFWTRQYGRPEDFPQIIHSAKRFAGPTGIEEYLGLGFGIALRLAERDGALLFLSDHYFVKCFGIRWRLPRWLAPGDLTIGHVDCGGGRFAFTLDLLHRYAGELVHQVGLFADAEQGGEG